MYRMNENHEIKKENRKSPKQKYEIEKAIKSQHNYIKENLRM